LVAAAEANVEPTIGEYVGGGDFFGDNKGMMQGEDDDSRADAYPFRDAGEVGCVLKWTREVTVRREMMLRAPDAIEPEFVGGLGNSDAALEDFLAAFCAWRLEQKKSAKIHRCSPGLVSAFREGSLGYGCDPEMRRCTSKTLLGLQDPTIHEVISCDY
jgi:hypothetical protein